MKILLVILSIVGIILLIKKKPPFKRKFDPYKDDPYYSKTYEDPHGDGG